MTLGLIHTIKNYERLTIEGYLQKDENLIKKSNDGTSVRSRRKRFRTFME